MNVELAQKIISFIDFVHQPYYWTFIVVVAFFYSFESYLPKKTTWESRLDRYIGCFKFGLICILAFIVVMQGITGGCIFQIPQNYLAQNYLGLPYWYPFGLVFRENIDQSYWGLLRAVYLLLGSYYSYTAVQFWQKRMVK